MTANANHCVVFDLIKIGLVVCKVRALKLTRLSQTPSSPIASTISTFSEKGAIALQNDSKKVEEMKSSSKSQTIKNYGTSWPTY